MMNKRITELQRGLTTAFINQSVSSNLAYKPQFISNNYKQGQKVLSSIEDELLICDEFCISVAFITMSGITPLLQTVVIILLIIAFSAHFDSTRSDF
jgi:HKD family nuclease